MRITTRDLPGKVARSCRQTPVGAQLDLGTQSHYQAPGFFFFFFFFLEIKKILQKYGKVSDQ